MEMILTCEMCGHREVGGHERMLITKVRMLNHLTHSHPDAEQEGSFKDLVAEETSVAGGYR